MCWYWFPLNNFCRDTLILLKLCRRVYHCKIQVKFDICNHPQNFGWAMALLRLTFGWCVDIVFRSITFTGMHWFYWKFAEGYVIVKYRSFDIGNRLQYHHILFFHQHHPPTNVYLRGTSFGFTDSLVRFRWCVDICFCSITFTGMHWFYWMFAEGYIIWPFFDLAFVVGVKYKVKILFPLNNFLKGCIDFVVRGCF